MIYLVVGLVAVVSVIAIALEIKAKKKAAQAPVQEQPAIEVVSQVVEAAPAVVAPAPKKKAAPKKAAKTAKTTKKGK